MEYVTAWRMGVARDLLLDGRLTNVEIAGLAGYGSASAFGLAFVRHQGVSTRLFVARGGAEAPAQENV